MFLLFITIAILFVAIGLVLAVRHVLQAHKKPVVSGYEELIGSVGTVIMISGEERPRIRIRGELWQIRSDTPLKEHQLVKVIALDELILVVQPFDEKH